MRRFQLDLVGEDCAESIPVGLVERERIPRNRIRDFQPIA
jgi:hypothetical protein